MRRTQFLHVFTWVTAALVAAGLQVVYAPQATSNMSLASLGPVNFNLQLSPFFPMRGETFAVTGYVDRHHSRVRTVRLQRPSGGSWKTTATVKTRSNGRFSFAQTADRGGATQVRRVYVPDAEISGTSYDSQVSDEVTVTPDSQELSLSLPTTTQVGKSLQGLSDTQYKFRRRARVVDVQLQSPSTGGWSTVRSTTLVYAGSGGWPFTLKPTKVGTFVYRAVARAYHGAGRKISVPVKMIVSRQPAGTFGAMKVVNIGADGSAPSGEHPSGPASMSGDGRYVAYWTDDPGVAAGGNPEPAVVLEDRRLGTTRAISIPGYYDGVAERGTGFPVRISHDGRFVVYLARTNPDRVYRIYRYDVATGTNALVSRTPSGDVPNGDSAAPSVSADGRYVVYSSVASDVLTSDPDATSDVFRWDGQTGATTLVSKTAAASTQPAISGDGRYVAFRARASNLQPGVSSTHQDIYTYDTVGDFTNIVTYSTIAPEPGNGDSSQPEFSADGSTLVFGSAASNLVAGDTNGRSDVFRVGPNSSGWTIVSRGANDAAADGDSFSPTVSATGRFIAYGSEATNLVPSDTNGATDLFHRDMFSGTTIRATPAIPGAPPGDSTIAAPSISDDGTRIVFSQPVGTDGRDWDDIDYIETVYLWLLGP
ncbi:MAG: hypothetical protein ABIR34_01005 [Marmoricola sp.]